MKVALWHGCCLYRKRVCDMHGESDLNAAFMILRRCLFLMTSGFLLWSSSDPIAADSAPPRITGIQSAAGQARVRFTPYPGAEAFRLLKSGSVEGPFQEAPGPVKGYEWQGSADGSAGFYRLEVKPMDPKALMAATVLNRLAYGPTPEDVERVLTGPEAIGAEAYIEEQLAPEKIQEDLGLETQSGDGWEFVSTTGTASSSVLYLYMNSASDVFIDDVSLVKGSVAGIGSNLLKNGDFETPLAGSWTLSANHVGTELSTVEKHGGASSLHLVALSAGASKDTSVWQTAVPSLASGQTYTLSFYYKRTVGTRRFTARLSGSGISTQQPSLGVLLTQGAASITDLQAWHTLHAVRSKRQLNEVLVQFVDNHFTTLYSKSAEYIDGKLTNNVDRVEGSIATDFEYRELNKWRQVLLNPHGTFFDLLKISIESPAMVIYLDTATSTTGNANENFSRELLELFTMGVDNGYDQHDIEEVSRAWTGWRADKLPVGQETNPFATRVANRDLDPGYWTLQFRTANHDGKAKTIFPDKTVDARFGPPYAGKSYKLILPARTANAGMQDGYDIIKHLADLPYTQEYLCVKLCQVFVHENFHHGVYDYTAEGLSSEARLVRECMNAWEQPGSDGRKGNLRAVLRTIFKSELFRGQGASRQKAKTPFEYAVSAVRSLRATQPAGGYTAETDGYDFQTALLRLNMRLFYREEPDGWSEFGREWISTASMMERLRFVQNLLAASTSSVKDDDYGTDGVNNTADPVALLKLRLAAGALKDAGAVVDLFLKYLFLGEGAGNLSQDREAAIAFLNSNDTGARDSSPLGSLDPSSVVYDARVRGMVAFLLSLPRFHEQ